MVGLDPKDFRSPRLPFNCPHCGLRLAYIGTHHPSPDPLATHIYYRKEHGLFEFRDDWGTAIAAVSRLIVPFGSQA